MSQQYVFDDAFDLKRAPQRDDRRIYVRANVSLPCGEIDPNTLRPVSSYRPGRVQAMQIGQKEKERELEKERNRKGVYISLRTAVLAVAFTMFVLGLMAVSQYGRLTEQQKLLNEQNDSIESCVDDIERLSSAIDAASDQVNICFTAANELDMVPADSDWISTYVVVAASARPDSREQANRDLQVVSLSAQSARANQP